MGFRTIRRMGGMDQSVAPWLYQYTLQFWYIEYQKKDRGKYDDGERNRTIEKWMGKDNWYALMYLYVY